MTISLSTKELLKDQGIDYDALPRFAEVAKSQYGKCIGKKVLSTALKMTVIGPVTLFALRLLATTNKIALHCFDNRKLTGFGEVRLCMTAIKIRDIAKKAGIVFAKDLKF